MDVTLIRERLAAAPGTNFVVSAGTIGVPAGDDGALSVGGPDPVPAAVLVPIVTGPSPGILLTKRAAQLRRHGGQVSFPGGRIDPGDAGPEDAALREAWEEIGLAREDVELVGRMQDYVTGTGFRVTPVIGLLPPGLTAVLAPAEVESLFQLDLSVLLDPAAPERRRVKVGDRWREFWVWPHADHYIWGATAAILVGLADLLRSRS